LDIFWKRRTEKLLGKKLIDSKVKWKNVYYCIADALNISTNILHGIILQYPHNNEVNTFKILLDSGYNPSLGYNSGINLLTESLNFYKIDITEILLKDKRISSYTLMPILKKDYIDIIGNIASRGVIELLLNDIRVDQNIKLELKYILDHRIEDPQLNHNVLLEYAIKTENLKVIKSLLRDPKINSSAYGNIVLQNAIKQGSTPIVQLLLNSNIDLPTDNTILNTALYQNGNRDYIVQLLLKDGRSDPFDTNLDHRLFESHVFKDTIKNEIKDRLYGATLGGNWVRYNYIRILIDENIICYTFLKYLIRSRLSLINAIRKLNILIYQNNNIDKIISRSIYYASMSVMNTNAHVINAEYKTDTYYAIRGFLLLSFKPEYTYIDIIDILTKEHASNKGLIMAGQFIGAYKGLNKLVSEGLYITDNIKNNMNKIGQRDLKWLVS
jgi:hypothetical protein